MEQRVDRIAIDEVRPVERTDVRLREIEGRHEGVIEELLRDARGKRAGIVGRTRERFRARDDLPLSAAKARLATGGIGIYGDGGNYYYDNGNPYYYTYPNSGTYYYYGQ